MARNRKRKQPAPVLPARQAPNEVWSPEELLAVLDRHTDADRLAILKSSGILDEHGEVSQLYITWGDKPSCTPYDEF